MLFKKYRLILFSSLWVLLAFQNSSASPPAAQPGAELVLDNGCKNCHVIGGEGGKIGPLLDGIKSRHDRAYIVKRLTNPNPPKYACSHPVPQELMSHLNVSNEEASAIADYLLGLTAKNVESKPGKSSASVSGEHKYKHYVNEEFKYSIEYPSDELQVDSRVKSGTGLILNSADQKTFMHTDIDPPFHFEDGHKLTLDEVFKDALTEGSKVLRKEKGDNWFIVARAGTKFDPRYAFKKVLFGKTVKEAVMIKTFEIVYPQSKSSQYESMIKHISDSFRNLP